MLLGWRPIGAKEVCAPEPPAFKVGDDIEVVGSCNYEHNGQKSFRGQTGKITDVDLPDKHSTYLAHLSGGSTLWFPASSLKLLPPMPCIPAEAEYEYTVDPTMTNVVKGLLKTKPITPEATVKLRTATHGPASRTTLEVDKSIFPLSDIKGINAALKPYGLHMQKTGKKK